MKTLQNNMAKAGVWSRILTITLVLLSLTGCSNTDEGQWRGRINVDKGVRSIVSDWPILHHPDSLMQVVFKKDLTIEGRNDSEQNFTQAYGITTDKEGNIYLADALNFRIQKYDEDGNYITSVGSKGVGPTQFKQPVDVAINDDGLLYVLDFEMNRVTVFNSDLEFEDLFNTTIIQPRRIRIDSDGNIIIFAITQHDLIYKYSPQGELIDEFYDPVISTRIIGTLEQLIAYSDSGMETTDDAYIYVSSRHPYRIRKYDRVAGLALEFSRATPFEIVPLERWPGNEQPPPVGISGALAVLPDDRVINIVQYQEFRKVGLNSYGRPQIEISKVDRYLDVFTSEGKWQLTSKITEPGFPVHTDRQGRIYFNELEPPKIVRYIPEFPEGAD